LKTTFKGKPVLPAHLEGEAVVTRVGFNAYASFYTSIHVPVDRACCDDRSNPDLYGKGLTGKILCLPKTTGSTSAGERREQLMYQVARGNRATRVRRFFEQEVWPIVPKGELGRRLSRAEEEAILGYG
jgi:predicted aconitase with swiveling domain